MPGGETQTGAVGQGWGRSVPTRGIFPRRGEDVCVCLSQDRRAAAHGKAGTCVRLQRAVSQGRGTALQRRQPFQRQSVAVMMRKQGFPGSPQTLFCSSCRLSVPGMVASWHDRLGTWLTSNVFVSTSWSETPPHVAVTRRSWAFDCSLIGGTRPFLLLPMWGLAGSLMQPVIVGRGAWGAVSNSHLLSQRSRSWKRTRSPEGAPRPSAPAAPLGRNPVPWREPQKDRVWGGGAFSSVYDSHRMSQTQQGVSDTDPDGGRPLTWGLRVC